MPSPKDRTVELLEMSKGLYLTIMGLTETPKEFVAIISMLHLHLFLNHGDPNASVDSMLEDYAKNFKKNWQANKEKAS